MKLIKNGLVRGSADGKPVYEKKDILISGSRISAVGTGMDCEGAEVTDAEGKIVIPGLVNSHLHSHDNFNKAWLENMPLEIWMPAVRPFFSGVRHTKEQVYYRTLLGAVEMLHTGTTAVMDDVLLNGITDAECLEAIVRAYEDIGMRAVVSPHTKNISMEKTIPYAEELFTEEMKRAVGAAFPPEEEIIGFMEESIRRYNLPESRVTIGLSTSAPQRSTVKLMEGFRDLSLKYHVPVSCHVLETYVQKKTGELFYGKSLVRYLFDLGLLNPNFVLIHCNWISGEDLDRMADCGCKAVHNPACNLRMGSGIAPTEKMIRKIPVGLGTDNISASDSANLFEAMKIGCLISKVKTAEYRDWLSAADMMEMATAGGSKCLCREEEIGLIREGMKADLTILDADNEHYAMAADIDMALTYSENGSAVEDVLVDGEFVLKHKKLIRMDKNEIFRALKDLRGIIAEEHELAMRECRGVTEVFDRCYRRCNADRL